MKRKKVIRVREVLTPHIYPKKSPLVFYSDSFSHLPCALFGTIQSLTSFHHAHSTRPEEEEDPVSLGVVLGERSGNKNVYELGLTLHIAYQ